MCHKTKPVDDFAFRNKATGRRQGHCRQCHAAYRRKHYLANKAEYVSREVARIRGYRIENRALLRAYLAEHPCVDCGETDVIVLEFDHRDRAAKTAAITVLAARRSWRTVLREIERCDVRCVSCHRRRTAEQLGWRKTRPVQLSIASLVDNRRASTKDFDANEDTSGTRRCRLCGAIRPTGDFAYRNKAIGKRRTECRPCWSAYMRRHYEQNRGVYLDRAKRRRKSDRRLVFERILQYLSQHPCVDCGETDPILLDFDHRDPDRKAGNIGEFARRGTWTQVSREIEKCDVRCAKCHRRKTAQQFGWAKLAIA